MSYRCTVSATDDSPYWMRYDPMLQSNICHNWPVCALGFTAPTCDQKFEMRYHCNKSATDGPYWMRKEPILKSDIHVSIAADGVTVTVVTTGLVLDRFDCQHEAKLEGYVGTVWADGVSDW